MSKIPEIDIEAYDNTVVDQRNETEDSYGIEMNGVYEQRPIVLVASKGGKLRDAIENICLCLARTYKDRIMALVPRLCQNCNITEADQIFDSDQIANEIVKLAVKESDEMFLQQFAYTQIFNFIVENYIAALN